MNAPSEAQQAAKLNELLTGDVLLTLEPASERLYFHAGGQRIHRSKLMAWWRRGWIELENEDVDTSCAGDLGRERRRTWELTSKGQDAVKGATT